MQKCDYCGFVTKYNLNHCPSCGATQYTKIDNFSNYEIKDCSKIKLKCLGDEIPNHSAFYYIIGVILTIVPVIIMLCSYFHISLIDYDFTQMKSYYWIKGLSVFAYIFILFCAFNKKIVHKLGENLGVIALWIPWIFLGLIEGDFNHYAILYVLFNMISFAIIPIIGVSALREFIDYHKKRKMVKRGYLIKNVKYELIPDSENPLYKRIKVDYTSKDGIKLDLVSSQCINYIPLDDTVDVLIDQNNLNNYYIDFEIV